MRILVTWGSRSGGTAEIGETLAQELRQHGFDVTALPADKVESVAGYDAAVIGGAIYANLWHRDAHHLVEREIDALRRIPVWLFSSGPLDDSAEHGEPPTPKQIGVLAERLGAIEHVTFGGRLAPDASSFPASAMAKTRSGDWRHLDRVRLYAAEIARRLPTAKPHEAHEPAERSPGRLLVFSFVAGALSAASLLVALSMLENSWAFALHAAVAPIFFTGTSLLYFGPRGARDPLPTAATFVTAAVVFDVLAVLAAGRTVDSLLTSWTEWLSLALIFGCVWAVGQVTLMLPTTEQQRAGGALPNTRSGTA